MTLREKLERKRAGYDVEVRWHRFLIDAHHGTGGFCGQIEQPLVGWWGRAAEVYARATALRTIDIEDRTTRTYLDRFPREDREKFESRIAVAHYDNQVKGLTKLKLGYLARTPPTRSELPRAVADWLADFDGEGSAWDKVRPQVWEAAAVLGWVPVMLDAGAVPEGATVAQAREAGADRIRAMVLTPAELLNYELDDRGRFVWAIVRLDREERPTWDSDAERVSRFLVWTADKVAIYELREPAEGQRSGAASDPEPMLVDERPHAFGAVPIVIFRAGRVLSEPLKGEALHGNEAIRNRRVFNLDSELDEHLRSQVFAILQVPTEDSTKIAELQLGTDNALAIKPDSGQPYAYIAPPATVAETYETRTERIVQEMYRSASVEWVRTSGANTSAASKRSEFDATNAVLCAFGESLAEGERTMLRLGARFHRVSDDEIRKIDVTGADDYDVEALADDVAQTSGVLAIDAGPTFRGFVLRQFTARYGGRALSAKDLEKIHAEIDERVTARESAIEAALEAPEGSTLPPLGGGEMPTRPQPRPAPTPPGRGAPPPR